ncbi:MAG: hypothetical protein BGO45_05460 [Microbacterium sp. 71-36]|uniref:hypothetical protein n=1 Tax=unclassified Microbacterium TaxID=2609290 RepID=UPI00086F85E0|nr:MULTISPECIES: hypothetical protein [unclassified Microbacterium]MBN9211293.1 hypothetical protein [Microbacterium sp.]ODT36701.1 MAG: hypothetical protein ABS60_15070 [Microbacterium sp. SCN 71-17]OJV75144.1 MAG: hypothetical protein BGO45_05460 [Microbacterium sp. 71-36]
MAYFIALGILALIGTGSTLWLVRTDGHRRVPTDPRRLPGGTELRAAREDTAAATAPEDVEAPRRAAPGRIRRGQRGATARA